MRGSLSGYKVGFPRPHLPTDTMEWYASLHTFGSAAISALESSVKGISGFLGGSGNSSSLLTKCEAVESYLLFASPSTPDSLGWIHYTHRAAVFVQSVVTEAPRHLSTWHLDFASDGHFYSKEVPQPFLPCLPPFPDRNHDGDNQNSRRIFQKQLISKNQHCNWVLALHWRDPAWGMKGTNLGPKGTQTCKHANTSW